MILIIISRDVKNCAASGGGDGDGDLATMCRFLALAQTALRRARWFKSLQEVASSTADVLCKAATALLAALNGAAAETVLPVLEAVVLGHQHDHALAAKAADAGFKMDKGYGDLKKEVAEAVIAEIEPIQARYRELTADPSHIDGVLAQSVANLRPIVDQTMDAVRRAMGHR